MLLLCVTGQVGMAVPRSLRRSQRPRTRRRWAAEPVSRGRGGDCAGPESGRARLCYGPAGGRLRRHAGGRRRRVKVLLSPEEEAWVVPTAAAEGPPVQRFLVESALPKGRPSLVARRALNGEFLAVCRKERPIGRVHEPEPARALRQPRTGCPYGR